MYLEKNTFHDVNVGTSRSVCCQKWTLSANMLKGSILEMNFKYIYS